MMKRTAIYRNVQVRACFFAMKLFFIDKYMTIVDGNWSLWSLWSDCSVSCGYAAGVQTRKRACDDPAPDHGGMECPGVEDGSRDCDPPPPLCTSENIFTVLSLKHT